MPVPDFQTLMLPVLRETSKGPVAAPELRRRIAEDLRLTDEDLAEMLPSGKQTRFSNRVAWANVHLQRAGLIGLIRRGVYEATEEGRKLLAQAPGQINLKLLDTFPAHAEWREQSNEARDQVAPEANPPLGPAGSVTPESL